MFVYFHIEARLQFVRRTFIFSYVGRYSAGSIIISSISNCHSHIASLSNSIYRIYRIKHKVLAGQIQNIEEDCTKLIEQIFLTEQKITFFLKCFHRHRLLRECTLISKMFATV